MLKDERFDKIEAYVNQNKYATIKELSEYLDISCATIRRDIKVLADMKKISVTRGGVVAIDSREAILSEDSYLKKAESNQDEKMRIAREACRLITPGSTVIVDSGTTTLQMVPFLKNIPDLCLVTNDVYIAAELSGCSNLNINVLGGNLRQGYYSLVGYYAENVVSDMHADLCIIGTDAVSFSGGLMISNLEEVGLKRSLIAASNKVVVVCDHTKFKTKAFLSICSLDKVDIFITGEEADEKIVHALRSIGKQVLVVPRGKEGIPVEDTGENEA